MQMVQEWHQAVGGNVNLYAITPAIDADGNIYVANRKMKSLN